MRLPLIALALVTAQSGAAQERRLEGVLGRVEGAFLALSVADIGKQTAWYRDTLGFTVVASGEAPSGVARFALLQAGWSVIELIQHRDARSRAVIAPQLSGAHQLHGFFKGGFTVTSLDSVYTALRRRGVPIAYDLMPAKDLPLRSFAVRDAEGNLIQFFGR